MENATKALEMAGSLLIGVLLLGCLLFAYTRMSELKDTEHKVEVSQQAQDFNQDYETYSRNNLYVSAVIVNSRKGQKIFEDIQQDIIAEETSIESVTKRNLNLKRPTPFPAIRKTVYNSIDNKQYKEYTKENLHFRINPKDIIKQVMPQKLKNTIKKTLKK